MRPVICCKNWTPVHKRNLKIIKPDALRRQKNFARRGAAGTVRELQQLSKIPDSKLARRNQRTIKEVVAMRESRRIALPTPPRRWTAREIRLLGTLSDRETARRLRRPVET